jgi:hypothetical protein
MCGAAHAPSWSVQRPLAGVQRSGLTAHRLAHLLLPIQRANANSRLVLHAREKQGVH